LHGVDGLADEVAAVVEDVELRAFGQLFFDLGEAFFDRRDRA